MVTFFNIFAPFIFFYNDMKNIKQAFCIVSKCQFYGVIYFFQCYLQPLPVLLRSENSWYIFFTSNFFLHSVIFIDWMYCGRLGPENRGCLSVCVSVCLCVCLWRAVWQNYWADFNKTSPHRSPDGLVVRICDLAH